MDKIIQSKWVAALRSGEYPQGQNMLKSRSGDYCCLGVLCEIHPDVVFHEEETASPNTQYIYSAVHKGDMENRIQTQLPESLEKELGISSGLMAKVMEMNDLDGANFNQIADVIEQEA